MSYKIIRFYFNDDISNRVVKRGLTLDEAQAHCQDPETSSSTCQKRANVKRTEQRGKWFDGYEKDS